jgi:cyclase
MDQVAPGVYVETKYESGNVGFIVTGAGVVCVDAPMLPSDVRDWKAQILSATDEPIITLIQTDYDQARVVGTYLFDVPLVAHDAIMDRIKIYGSEKAVNQISELIARSGGIADFDQGGWQVRMPDVTFSERLVLYKGECMIHVLHGGGHSSATSMVHLPEHDLLFSGDVVFCNQHPSMTYAETKEWLSALNQLRKMSVETIVPGHGTVCGQEATQPLSEYIRDIRAIVRRNFQAGRSKSETSSSVIPEFLDAFPYAEAERDRVRQRIKGGSDRIYDEYRAQAKANVAKSRGSTKRSKSKRSQKAR